MGFDFNKEATDKLAAEFLENNVYGDKPLSEDLPDNIEEIERIVGEAFLEGKINLVEPHKDFIKKLEELLRSKGVMPDWDIQDLSEKIGHRLLLRKHSWDFGLGKNRADRLAIYETIKDRPCAKQIIAITGSDYIPYMAQLTFERIKWLDKELSSGKSYSDITAELELDDPPSLLALLAHLEETHKTTITNLKQYCELLREPEDENDAKHCSIALNSAFEIRYRMTLDRILVEGGKYAQLIALNPSDFNLPESWHGISLDMNKEKVVRRAITDYFKLDPDSRGYGRVSLRDVATLIEAPYVEVLKASHYYSDIEAEEN